MSPVTPENVKDHKGWKVTPLGRIVHPIKMRPSHPLPDPVEDAPKSKAKSSAGKEKEKKRKLKEPPTRARKRTIDPTKWNSKHLKGAFLDAVVAYPEPTLRRPEFPKHDEASSSSSQISDDDDESDDEASSRPQISTPTVPVVSSSSVVKPIEPRAKSPGVSLPDSDLLQEKKASLGLLQSLFGANDDDWGGRESLSDVDMDETQPGSHTVEADNDFEVVPKSKAAQLPTHASDNEVGEDTRSSPPLHVSTASQAEPDDAQASVGKPKLKDLFAHRDEEGTILSNTSLSTLLTVLNLNP